MRLDYRAECDVLEETCFGFEENIEPKVTVLLFDKKPLQPAAAHGCQHLEAIDPRGFAGALRMFERSVGTINF
jgi:hypothetical protein